jgi:hypothetical protein
MHFVNNRVAQKNVYTLTCKIKSKECIHFFGPLCMCEKPTNATIIHSVYYVW